MSDLPTPDELGDMLKAGKITKEQAVEIMSERARREALGGLYGPPAEAKRSDPRAEEKARIVIRSITVTMGVLALILVGLLVWIALRN
jgi:hypothetical protein